MGKKALLLMGCLWTAAWSAAAQENSLTARERAAGWKLLFDGNSFEGWRGYRQTEVPASWRIESGMIRTIAGAKGGDLITVEKFEDFELSWEWRISSGGNNGVKYFVTEDRPAAPGHEYQMIDDAANEERKNGPTHATAAFYDVLGTTAERPLKPAGEWNLSRVVVQGNHVEHWLNGTKVLEYELGSDPVRAGLAKSKFKNFPDFGSKIRGHIMLTYHQDECWFRNVKIRELPSR